MLRKLSHPSHNKDMRTPGFVRACVFLFLMPFAAVARAQEATANPATTTAEVTLDLRSRAATNTAVSSELYSTYANLRTNALLGRGQYINLRAVNQYRAFRWQRASIETDLRVGKGQGDPPLRLEAGVVRLPFGIYDFDETYASGLIAYPLPRSDYAFNAVDWSVPGATATGNIGAVQVEAAAFGGQGAGVWGNVNGVDGKSVRLQTEVSSGAIVGASYWRGHQAAALHNPLRGRVHLGGLDMRYTRSHLVLRGEALAGTLAGSATQGAYLDAYYRLPGIETVTLVARGEFLKPDAALPTSRQVTVGGRWNASGQWVVSANWSQNNLARAYTSTWTRPTGRGGALLVQVLRRFSLD